MKKLSGFIFIPALLASLILFRQRPSASPAFAQPIAPVTVVIRAEAGVELRPLVEQAFTRPSHTPSALQTIIARVDPAQLPTIAARDGVIAVQPAAAALAEPLLENDGSIPPPTDPAILRQRLAARGDSRQNVGAKNVSASPTPHRAPDDWFEITDPHRTVAAWDNGYTGDGVTVLVNDSGIDFCHPDLLGAWATVSDPASPYDGWPMMFDAYSLYLYALDQNFGESNIADGRSDYADTSATCAAPCLYQPIGASQPHTYTLPATSVGGLYRIGSHPDTRLEQIYGERVAVLVADEAAAGIYDTVYVDLDGDHEFSDEQPVNRAAPAACWDSDDDGYNDLSGGLVYFIADGIHPIPASDWLWGGAGFLPDNGALVAFALLDTRQPGGRHGQWVASNVAAQGVIDGERLGSTGQQERPAWKPAGGMVYGAGKNAKLTANGNFYQSPFVEDGFLFAALGYDGLPNTADDSQIINNSWANSGDFNDGWDEESRLIESILQLNPTLAALFGAGNGGPGYGTLESPTPPSGIDVGGSTLFGSTAVYDSITTTQQILWGDMIPFSGRGPGATGVNGVDVAATAATAPGSDALNVNMDGWSAWISWSGVSRATPVAAGNLALVYDAYKQAHGSWPDAVTARDILMGSATDLGYDPFVQGAGLVNAEAATAVAAQTGGFFAQPSSFASFGGAGEGETAVFTVNNPSSAPTTLEITSGQLRRSGGYTLTLTTKDQALEDDDALDLKSRRYPDYLLRLDETIPPATDLLEVKIVFPFNQFDPDGDYNQDQSYQATLLNWTDINGDGNLWTDDNGDGIVNADEIDAYEYNRFVYDNNPGNALQLRLGRPSQRIGDGLFLDLRHYLKSAAIPTTTFTIEVNFYEREAWDWLTFSTDSLTVAANETAVFTATLTPPAATPPGLYNGAIVLDSPLAARYSLLPIAANVTAELGDAPLILGATAVADTPYDNGRVSGYTDWAYRPSAGDWRIFYLTDAAPAQGMSSLIINNIWPDNALPYRSDIDTLIYAPETDAYGSSLTPRGGSVYAYNGGGKWHFSTSTDGPADEVVSSAIPKPESPALNAPILLMEHQVLFQGDRISMPFTQTVGALTAVGAPLTAYSCASAGLLSFTVKNNIPLAALHGSTEALVLQETGAQGGDLILTGLPVGAVEAGERQLTLTWDQPVRSGEIWRGMVYLGIPGDSDALEIPFTLYPCQKIYLPAIIK